MAQDGEPPKPVDKGKGKAVDNGSKAEDAKVDKDAAPVVNGKKEEGATGGWQSIPPLGPVFTDMFIR